jgi:hypothetical protein
MSQKNVGVLRASWAGLCFERRNVRFDPCDERIELRTAAKIPVTDEYRAATMKRANGYRRVGSVEFHNDVEEIVEAEDGGTVVTVVRTNGLMRHTGVGVLIRSLTRSLGALAQTAPNQSRRWSVAAPAAIALRVERQPRRAPSVPVSECSFPMDAGVSAPSQ